MLLNFFPKCDIISEYLKRAACIIGRYLAYGEDTSTLLHHIRRDIEVGTFASAACGRRSEQKGVAAVEILRSE